MVSKGKKILGATLGNNVYLNPKDATINTSIHEFGHVWLDFIKETNPQLYKKGLELVEGTKELAKQQQAYPEIPEKARNEALATLIGNRGETIVDATKKSKFKNWLEGLWKYISDIFTGKKISDMTGKKAISELTLGEFIDGAIFDLLAGKTVSKTFGETKVGINLVAQDTIEWYESPEGKGDPSISSRKEELQKAAQNLSDGLITNEEY